MRKKNLILLTSITGLLLTLTPSQALAQESTAPTTSQSSDNNTSDSKDTRLPTDEKCHWRGETPVPENKYLKFLYDIAYKDYDKNVEEIKNGKYISQLQKLVDEGKMSDNEAQYRTALIHDRNRKDSLSGLLYFYSLHPLNIDEIKNDVNYTYDNPDNADEIVKEIIDSFSLKEFLEYADKYVDPDIHVSYSSKELHDKYQKEFDELDKVIDYDDNIGALWYSNDEFKVNKLLDKYSSEEEQVQRFIQLHNWLKFFPTEDSINKEKYNPSASGSISGISAYMAGDLPILLSKLKENNLDNNDFYNKATEYFNNDNPEYDQLTEFLSKYNIKWGSIKGAKVYTRLHINVINPLLFNPDLEIPRDVVCDDEEKPGEDNNTPINPETPGDKDATTSTTKTTSKKDKPSNKTSTKSSDKSTISTTTTTNEDKEEESISTPTPTTEPNQPTIPNQVNTPNTPITPTQEFTPVKNTKPGTFNGGVSSSVEREEISDGSKVDTGSPTTSILNKIRTIF